MSYNIQQKSKPLKLSDVTPELLQETNNNSTLQTSRNPDIKTAYWNDVNLRIDMPQIDSKSFSEKDFGTNVVYSCRFKISDENKNNFEYIKQKLCSDYNMQVDKACSPAFSTNNNFYPKMYFTKKSPILVKKIRYVYQYMFTIDSTIYGEELINHLQTLNIFKDEDILTKFISSCHHTETFDFDNIELNNDIEQLEESYPLIKVNKSVKRFINTNEPDCKPDSLESLKELVGENLRDAVCGFTVVSTVKTKTSPDVLEFSMILKELILDAPTDQTRRIARQVININEIDNMHDFVSERFCFGVPTSKGNSSETINQPYLIVFIQTSDSHREAVNFSIDEIKIEPHQWGKTGIFPKTDKYPSQNPDAKYHYKVNLILDPDTKISKFLHTIDTLTNTKLVDGVKNLAGKKIKHKPSEGAALNWDEACMYFASKGATNPLHNSIVINASPPEMSDEPNDDAEIFIKFNGKHVHLIDSFYERTDVKQFLTSLSCEHSITNDKVVLKFQSEEKKITHMKDLKQLLNFDRRVKYTGMYDDEENIDQWTPQIQINKVDQKGKENKYHFTLYDKHTGEVIDIINEETLLPAFQWYKYQGHVVTLENVVFRIVKVWIAMKREFGYRLIIISAHIDRTTFKEHNDNPPYEAINENDTTQEFLDL